MKKITFLLFLCFALFMHHAKAQFSALTIVNNTSCDIYYILYGAKAPSCVSNSKTGIIMIAAGTTVTFANPLIAGMPGLGTADYIVGAGVCNINPMACSIPTFDIHFVYHPCTGTPQSENAKIFDNNCNYCNTTDIKWSVGSAAQILYLN